MPAYLQKNLSFMLFYNGQELYNGDSILRLSDSFINTHAEYTLELSVKVVNINYDKDNVIIKRCEPLKQYSQFVDAVRHHIVIDREHGFETAIKECIQNDILREYLQRKSKEVLNMLIGEYDYDTDIAVQREESFDIGLAEGEARGSRQKAFETARLMLQRDYPESEICLMTGLTKEEVEGL